MRSILLVLCSASVLHAQPPGGRTTTVRLNGHTFTLPEGFTIELAAKTPQVDRPISASFDEEGRLYVTESSGSNERGPAQAEQKTNFARRLEDTDGDGVFDRSTRFADRLGLPEGALFHAGSFYVAAPPVIWKFTDTDNDGQADRREVWFDGKTVGSCANDLHGPFLGPDGWIYWCKGAWAPQTYTVHGKKFDTRASHVFRARPDGSHLEPVMAGGMDNPVGLAFTSTGDRIVSGTFFQFPAAGKRDGLLHALFGGIYGKDHDPIHDPVHKWTAPHVLPIMTHLGPSAPCGMIRFESDRFGLDYQDNLFCCLFNLQKVTRHVLVPDGATYKTQDFDFVVSDQKDFHPTDVVEAPDGSLLIIDTGGWYKICCPTSQLVKPDVLGAIYRVRRVGTPKLDDPLGKKIAWTKLPVHELCGLLDDPRPFVRKQAIERLGNGGIQSAKVLEEAVRKGRTPTLRRNAVWAAARLADPNTLFSTISPALKDRDAAVVKAAFHSMSLRFLDCGKELFDDPALTLIAAEGMGRWVSKGKNTGPFVSLLLAQAEKTTDPAVQHALTLALIEINDSASTRQGLVSRPAAARRVGLIALDQMGQARVGEVVAELESRDAPLREAAWWIVSRHPEWGADLTKHLHARLAGGKLSSQEAGDLVQQLAKLAKARAIQELLARFLGEKDASKQGRLLALQAMAQANLKEAPEVWWAGLKSVFAERDQDLLHQAGATVRALRLPKVPPAFLAEGLKILGENPENQALVRLTALSAIPGGLKEVEPSTLDFLLVHLKSTQPAGHRALAAETLGRARLTSEQLHRLTQALPTAGTLELDRLLGAFGQTKDNAVGTSLLKALEAPGVRLALRADQVKTVLAKFGPEIQKHGEPLVLALNADAMTQKARLEGMLEQIREGDIRRGQAVFNSTKTSCTACHTIGYVGGKLGPDLTRIGSIRTERDLLEAILFPSASFVRSYEPIVIVTSDGKSHNGLVKAETPEEITLVTGVNQEVRIARTDIEEMAPSKVSVMPAGLDQQLSPRDLADLVAFLKACR